MGVKPAGLTLSYCAREGRRSCPGNEGAWKAGTEDECSLFLQTLSVCLNTWYDDMDLDTNQGLIFFKKNAFCLIGKTFCFSERVRLHVDILDDKMPHLFVPQISSGHSCSNSVR